MLIAFLGAKNCGKSTAASYLKDNFGFVRESFASPLKDMCSILYGWDRELLEGDTQESRIWREQVDEKWAKILNIPDFSPRRAMEIISVDLFRNQFHPDIWIHSLLNRAKQLNNCVISDCRHLSEIPHIKAHNGIVIRIEKGPLPTWTDIALKANQGDLQAIQKMRELGISAGEYEWLSAPYDHLLTNNDTLDEFKYSVDNLYRRIWRKKHEFR